MKKCVKNDQLHFRVTAEQKEQFHELAKQRGLSITELMLALKDNVPLRDYKHEQDFFTYLNDLTRQLQYIGNNINQVAVAIHQIKNEHRFPLNELETFNTLMKQYAASRESLSKQLSTLFFR